MLDWIKRLFSPKKQGVTLTWDEFVRCIGSLMGDVDYRVEEDAHHVTYKVKLGVKEIGWHITKEHPPEERHAVFIEAVAYYIWSDLPLTGWLDGAPCCDLIVHRIRRRINET